MSLFLSVQSEKKIYHFPTFYTDINIIIKKNISWINIRKKYLLNSTQS